MKIEKVLRCMTTMLAATAMTIGLMGMNISKVEAAGTTVDGTAKGSMTIHKYVGESIADLGEYPSQKELDTAVKNAGERLKPLEGVTFKYVKIGDMGQYDKEGNVRTGYTVDAKTKEFLELTDREAEMTVNGKRYYNTDVMSQALKRKSQVEIETKYKSDNLQDITTNEDGIAKASELPLGLYLVYEYSYPSNVNVTTAPFFVSIPMTDDGKEWVYDVNVYPKNQTEKIDIRKTVLSDHGETKKADAEIGRNVTFKIDADVPDNIGKMKTFVVNDILGEGLEFVKENKVYGIRDNGTKDELAASVNYQFNRAGKQLSYAFNPETLSDAVKAAKYKSVEITYEVKLNEKAAVGVGNVNKASLTYSKKTNVEDDEEDVTITTDPVKAQIYTYAIDLLKYGSGDITNKLENVTFQLLDSEKNEIKVTKADEGYYLDKNGNDVLTSDKNGKIYVKGIRTGTYYLRETKTNKGYNLLKEDIEIKITAENETYMDESAEGISVKSNYTMTNGNVMLKVNNTKGFLLPATGGKGAVVFLIFGGLLVIAGILILKGTVGKKNQAV